VSAETKVCGKCGEEKPLEGFSRSRSARDGLQGRCKACCVAYARGWRHLKKLAGLPAGHFPSPSPAMKACKRCRLTLPLVAFGQTKGMCRPCCAACAREWRIHNKEHQREYRRRYYRTAKGRSFSRRRGHRRRIRKLGGVQSAIVALTAEHWASILSAYDHRCRYCGRVLDDTAPPTQDHVHPVSRGGRHTPGNVVPACQPCNSSKHAKLPAFHAEDIPDDLRWYFEDVPPGEERAHFVIESRQGDGVGRAPLHGQVDLLDLLAT